MQNKTQISQQLAARPRRWLSLKSVLMSLVSVHMSLRIYAEKTALGAAASGASSAAAGASSADATAIGTAADATATPNATPSHACKRNLIRTPSLAAVLLVPLIDAALFAWSVWNPYCRVNTLLEVKAIIVDKQTRHDEVEYFIEDLKKQDLLTAFDENVWLSMVDYLTVRHDGKVDFTFLDGGVMKIDE